MSRIKPAETPDAKAQEMLDGVEKKLGSVPNIFKTMAHSPAILQFYFSGSDALGQTSLSAALREQIALVVAGQNACDYCASAHTQIAKGQGVSEDETQMNLKGDASDPKVKAALDFSAKLVRDKAHISETDLKALTDAGWSEAQALEIVTVVAFNIFTNYFNHVADTDVDFPHVSAQGIAKAA